MCNYYLKRVNVAREFNVYLGSRPSSFLLLLLLVVSQTPAETILIDDFNDGNDEGWTHLDLIAEGVNGPAIYDVGSFDYRISSTGSISDVEDPNTPNMIGTSWDASSDPTFSNGLMRTKFRITGDGTAVGLVMRLTGLDSPNFDDVTYYTFGATAFSGQGGQPNDGAFHFNRIEENKTTTNVVLDPGRSDLFDRDWIMEAGVVGDNLTMRYWPVGEAEPARPQWEWTDPNPLNAGILGLRNNIDGTGIRLTGAQGPFQIGAIFDDIFFTFPDRVAAPGSLRSGDADQDMDFDQLDLIRVQQSEKYLTGQAATWGEGDWDAAPGGAPGNPPTGNGLFDQFDIIAAAGNGIYLTGPYAAIQANGQVGDGQTSIIYDPSNGELSLDARAGAELTSIDVDSVVGIFDGEPAANLGGSFDNDADANIFKATFGGSFGSVSFGNVAQAGLSEEFVLGDLSVVGSLAGGGDLGDVDLVYVPEPTSVLLLSVGLVVGVLRFGRKR